MKTLVLAFALLAASAPAFAIQETFTAAGPLDCTAISDCTQTTADSLFSLKFLPTYPTSGPSATGFNVNEPSVEISNANGGPLDLNVMQINLTGSNFYNGVNFLGAIQLETQNAAGAWSYVTQWPTWIGSSRGIYVMFNGRNSASPLIKGVMAIRLKAINGGTMFKIGMMNLTAY